MGAYENPRFIPAPDYTVGLKAFEEKFKKGYEEGMQRGRDLVEQDKNYIAGIEETADQMRLEGEIAIENGLKTKEAVETEADDTQLDETFEVESSEVMGQYLDAIKRQTKS